MMPGGTERMLAVERAVEASGRMSKKNSTASQGWPAKELRSTGAWTVWSKAFLKPGLAGTILGSVQWKLTSIWASVILAATWVTGQGRLGSPPSPLKGRKSVWENSPVTVREYQKGEVAALKIGVVEELGASGEV